MNKKLKSISYAKNIQSINLITNKEKDNLISIRQ